MSVMRVSYINKDGVAITPVVENEYILWNAIDKAGIRVDRLNGFVYDETLSPRPRLSDYLIRTSL